MKYFALSIVLLILACGSLSTPAFAGIWPSPSQGGSEAKVTSFNTNLNGATSDSSSEVYKSGNSLSLSGGGDAEVGPITNKAKVKNSGNSEQSQTTSSEGGESSTENTIDYSSYYAATEATAASAGAVASAG